jgi:glycosyltransferase involved in cell wall biosynthesis
MTGAPLVSVIIPAYQAERYLDKALDSVLAQDYEPVEVIVVDDGSTDRTAEVAARRPVRLLRRPHRGIAAARNAGLQAATGEFVGILDADDLWPADRLSRQVGHLLAHPELSLVMGLTEIFLTPGANRPDLQELDSGRPVPGHPSTMLARREAFAIVGGFDESIAISNDVDWQARAKDAGLAGETLPHVFLRYRMHETNTTRERSDRINREMLRLVRDSVQRQRERAGG